MNLHHGDDVRIVGSPRRLVRRVAAVLAALLSVSAFAIALPATAVQPGSHKGTVVRDKPLTNTPHVLDGYVATFVELGGDLVVVGGNFTTVRTAASTTQIPRSHIFAFNKSTGAITSFAPALNGEVFSMLPTGDGQTVLVAGGFTSVNGQTVRSLVKLNVTTGQRVTQFKPPVFNGRIHDIVLRGNRLYTTGRFTTVAGQPHNLLAAVNPTTGALDPAVKIEFSEPRSGGALQIFSADVSPDGSRLVAVGNFTKIAGQPRYQIGMIDLTSSPVSVTNWSTNQYGDGCSTSFDSYMRDVEISPDGTFFVVVTTGAYSSRFLCDTAARWEIAATGSNLLPSWVNYTGGDTLTEVAITDTAVYLGGHQRAANNNYAADKIGPGAVQRTGLGAVDTRSGAPLNWNPGRTRGYGVYGFLATDAGLWIGSDTDRISGFQYRGRMAFMPLAGGTSMPSEHVGVLPGKVHLVGPTSPIGVDPDSVITRDFDGTTVSSSTSAAGTRSWRDARGAFMVEGVLYSGWSNGTFTKQTFNGTTFGAVQNVPLQRIDSSVSWGGTNGTASLNRFSTEDLGTVTGLFYDQTHGRAYFTRSGQSALFYRYFSTESDVFGAARITSVGNITGLNWSNVRGMFVAEGKLFTGDTLTGNLTRWTWDATAGRPVAGTGVVVSGPLVDGRDWRARDAFVYAPDSSQAPNAAPTARFTSACQGLTCSMDASASSDPDGTIVSYAWNFGDGSKATGVTANRTYAAAGTYTVSLTVTDDRGGTNTKTAQVSVVDPGATSTATFRAAAGVNVNSTTPTVTIPASVGAGDVLVLLATVNTLTPTVTGPPGWTLLDSGSDATATAQTFAWTKSAATGDAGTNARVTLSSFAKTSLQVLAYRGASTVSDHAFAFETVTRAEHTTPTVDVGSAGSLLISYWADKSSATTAWTLPAGAQLRDQQVGSGSGRIVAAVGDTESVPSGSGGGLTATADSSNNRAVTWSIVVAPAG